MTFDRIVAMQGIVARVAMDGGLPRADALNVAAQKLAQLVAPPFTALGPSFGLAWAECGLPVIETSHALAASLMATKVTREMGSDLPPPWRCFGIRIPAGLLSDAPGFSIALWANDGRVKMLSCCGNHFSLADEHGLDGYCDTEFVGPPVGILDAFPPGAIDMQRRIERMIGRLLVGVCAEIGNYPQTSTGGGRSIRMKRGEPKPYTYKLARPVRVDVRRAVREYVEGGLNKGPITVQILVRGHWKWQHCGTGNALRKWIHVEPYWRGPEDAPIAVRPHQIGRTS